MATIATTTNTTPFQYPSSKLLDRDPNTGYLYCMVKASTADNYTLYRSIDGGANWTSYITLVRAGLVELGSIFITNLSQVIWAYRVNASSQDQVYWRRLDLANPAAAWEGEIIVANPANGGVAGAVYSGIDVQVVISAGVTYIVVATGFVSGSLVGVDLHGSTISYAYGYILNNAIFAGDVRRWLYPDTAGRSTPSMDIEHTGDGKTSGAPHLWVTMGRARLTMVKLAWNGHGWSGSYSGGVQLATSITAVDSISSRWDGVRHLSVTRNPSSSSTVALYERNQSNTSTTIRTTPTHPQGVIRQCSVAYNVTSGNPRVYAVGTSTDVLYYVDYDRLTSTWSSWAQVLATAILGASVDNWGVRPSSYGNARHNVYTAHSGAPNTLTHTGQLQPFPPNTPVWVAPQSGAPQDVAAALVLDWDFSDPDPSQLQTAYAVRRQIGAGSFAYWRASDSTWQAAEVKNSSATTSLTLASSWALDSDANYSFAVKYWDTDDTASGYSNTTVVVPSAKANPSFTAPAAAATITTPRVTVAWTVSQQTAYRITLTTNPGGVLTYPGDWVTSAATSVEVPLDLADGTGWTIGLTTKNNEGLASTTQTRNFTVDYIEPATPTLVATPSAVNGWIAVVITNPAPSGGQPAVSGNDVYRRVTGDTSAGTRFATLVANNGTYNDWRAVSGVAYQYLIRTTGVNGTIKDSAWTA